MSPRPSLLVRSYGLILRLLPGDVLGSHQDEAVEVFADLYRDARTSGGWVGAIALWLRSVLGALRCAAQEGIERRASRFNGRSGAAGPGNSGGKKGRGDMVGSLMQDLHYAFRSFGRRPGFTAAAVVIVAVGIGATTTIFSVVDTVLLRSLPYPDAERLVYIDNGSHSYPDFRAWDANLEAFQLLGGVWNEEVDLTGGGDPEKLWAGQVTPDFFRVLGLRPQLGRLFTAEDHVGRARVVVLGAGLWARKFGSDPGIVGRTITVDGNPMVVAGVTSPEFRPSAMMHRGGSVDLWTPVDLSDPEKDDRGLHVLNVVGRLSEGASLSSAQAEMDAVMTALAGEFPDDYLNRDGVFEGFPLVPMHEATVRGISSTLLMLLGAVGLMLLIACANVANLMLARGMARARELALRGALGASRSRIVGQLLTESVLLALIGGLGGVVLAFVGVRLFATTNPGGIPRLEDVAVDPRVLLFAVAASLVTGVLFGILPAVQATRSDAGDALKDGAASVTTTRKGRRLRAVLVVTELALALILLVGAGLLFRSLTERLQVDPGIQTEQLVTMKLNLGPRYEDEERIAFSQELMDRIGAIPGVRSVAGGATLPFEIAGNGRCCWRTRIQVLDDPQAPLEYSLVHPVTQGYFATLGAPMTAGREFVDADGTAEPSVAILNKAAALTLFGEENPVGRMFKMGGDETSMTVVGTVAGVHHWGLDQDVEGAIYVPHARFAGEFPMFSVAVRTDLDLAVLAPALRETVWSLQPDQPINGIGSMQQWVSSSVATPRFLSILLGVFAGVALLLACAGIYSSMLYSVGQRQRELGIRVALGANRSEVTRLVLNQGVKLTLAGVALGVVGSLALSRVLQSLTWGVSPTDPITFAGVATLLSAVALLACYAPARRAARADPLESLRAE